MYQSKVVPLSLCCALYAEQTCPYQLIPKTSVQELYKEIQQGSLMIQGVILWLFSLCSYNPEERVVAFRHIVSPIELSDNKNVILGEMRWFLSPISYLIKVLPAFWKDIFLLI